MYIAKEDIVQYYPYRSIPTVMFKMGKGDVIDHFIGRDYLVRGTRIKIHKHYINLFLKEGKIERCITHLEQLEKLPSPIKENAISIITKSRGHDWLEYYTFSSLESVLKNGLPRMGKKWIDIWYLASIGEYDKPKTNPCVL